ncbi:MAG: DegT/DnrJ/EryC1/StrS family aminotransferase [Candidatus Heimdallarchaeota archaeon]|nr:DegT/DnrJ/EryC1/StrS family aminotransferase [Candidatus Heimdallarchaeota archaeon]
MIKLVNPQIGEEEREAVNAVLDSKYLAEGPVAREFEKEFAKYLGIKNVIVTSNGTTALHVALEATGVKPGDEVITTAFTFIASSNSILFNGAIPIFADIDPETYNIDPEKVEEKITKKTKAIMPVHIFGNPCDMKALKDISEDHNLLLLEDACQAHGAKFDGKYIGTFGDANCFSFYASKNLVFGEGGAIATDNDELKELIDSIRNHGRPPKGGYHHNIIGYNYRTNNISAAIGLVQLRKLPQMLETRKRNASILLKELDGLDGFSLQKTPEKGEHCWYIAVGRTDRNDLPVSKIIEELKTHEIPSRQIYSIPSYKQPAYTNINNYYHWSKFITFPDYSKVKLPITERIGNTHFEIPINPLVTEEDMYKITDVLKKIFT